MALCWVPLRHPSGSLPPLSAKPSPLVLCHLDLSNPFCIFPGPQQTSTQWLQTDSSGSGARLLMAGLHLLWSHGSAPQPALRGCSLSSELQSLPPPLLLLTPCVFPWLYVVLQLVFAQLPTKLQPLVLANYLSSSRDSGPCYRWVSRKVFKKEEIK